MAAILHSTTELPTRAERCVYRVLMRLNLNMDDIYLICFGWASNHHPNQLQMALDPTRSKKGSHWLISGPVVEGEFCTQLHLGCVRREQTSALSRCLNTRQVTTPPCIALHAWHHRLFRTNHLHEQLILVFVSIENPILSLGATNSIPGREELLKEDAKRLSRPPMILAETADEGAKHIVNMYKLLSCSRFPIMRANDELTFTLFVATFPKKVPRT
jgi:hypothetical protein